MLDAHAMPIHLTLAAMNAEPPSDTPVLDGLFEKLRTGSAEDRAHARGRIWAIWCSHQEDDAVHAMRSAVSALETGNLTNAGATLDAMVTQWPDWAEAWNKRATLRFIEDRDGESLGDIARTLEREPRHFGALGGFGQICLRAGGRVVGAAGLRAPAGRRSGSGRRSARGCRATSQGAAHDPLTAGTRGSTTGACRKVAAADPDRQQGWR